MALDIKVFQLIHGLSGISGIVDFFGVFLAEYLPYLMGVALLFFVFKREGTRNKLMAFFSIIFTALVSYSVLTALVDFFFPRERPSASLNITPLIAANGTSFPSAHAAFFFAVSFVLLSISKKWGVWFLFLSTVMGIARIFVGVHYPSDIVGGVVIGFVTFLIYKFLFHSRHESIISDEIPGENLERTEG
jgi:undecaprenyl-diphosphatase